MKFEFGLPWTAAVSTVDEGFNAVDTAGADFVGATLSGCTTLDETRCRIGFSID